MAGVEIFSLPRSNSQILATSNFSTNNDIVPWIGEKLHIGAEFQQFSRNNMYVRVPGKLSDIHSKVMVFSNPGDNIQLLGKLRDRFVRRCRNLHNVMIRLLGISQD